MGSASATSPPVSLLLLLCLLVATQSTITCSAFGNQPSSVVVSESAELLVSPSLVVENSPGLKPGTKVLCERLQIQGLSRLKHLKKFANSVKVKISYANPSGRLPNVEVCFHRNISIGIGMCPQGQWQKLTKGSWIRSMSPFDHKLLDIRMLGSFPETLVVSLEEEFSSYRIIFLALGVVLMTLASFLSKTLAFYYSGAMAVGILLVVLMVLFQGMKLLPTGRKNSLAIFMYSSMVGLGSFLLRYVPRLLRSLLYQIGIEEDMYNPLAVFLLVFLVIAGAWLGFWVVRKLVLTEDGSIDISVSHFVAWSIRIVASVMILQSSMDPLLGAEALICGIVVSSMLRRFRYLKVIYHLHRKLFRKGKSHGRKSHDSYASPVNKLYGARPSSTTSYSSPVQGLTTNKSPSRLSEAETFYSTFHDTSERRKFSKDEWQNFTKESTRKALEGLVSSPDFSEWAVSHADRITLAPKEDDIRQKKRWLPWF